MYLKVYFKIFGLYLVRVLFQKVPHIHDSCHDIRRNGFRDLTVFKQIGHRFAGIIVPLYLVNHGKMGADVVPETIVCFNVKIYHFFYVENVVGNIIDNVPQRFVVFIIVNGGNHVVIVPAPVFFPGQTIPNQTAVALQCKIRMYIVVIFRIQTDTLHHSAYRAGFWKLGVFYGKGQFIGNNFPSHFPVKRNGIGVQKRNWHLLLMHVIKHMFHKGMNQPFSGIFGVSGDACDAAHIHDFIVDIYFHGIHYYHGGELFFVKPSQYIGFFQYGTFGIFDFILLPSCLE